MKIKTLWAVVLVVFLSGCTGLRGGNGAEEDFPNAVSFEQIPAQTVLKNREGQVVGRAILVDENLWVTPDHLLQRWGTLLLEEEGIEVVVRDFEHDILVFRATKTVFENPVISPNPPAIGKSIFWFDGERIQEGSILAYEVNFEGGGFGMKKNLMTLSGIIEPGGSGTPVFDEGGVILGILIGADRSQGESYAIRSDVLLEFLAKNVLD